MARLWTFLAPTGADALARAVRRAEGAGAEGLWFPQLHSPPFPMMAAAAMTSARLRIGSGIALAFARSPVETALAALDLDALSGGRTVLGLGPGVQTTNEKIHGVVYGNPRRHLREVVRIVRDVIERGHTGELGLYEGEYLRVDLRGMRLGGARVRPSIPIHLSALFEGSIRLAAEIGDGVLGHPIWSRRWIETELARNVASGLAKAGRGRTGFEVNLWSYVTVDRDRRKAFDDARATVAFYASRTQYDRYFDTNGFGSEARAAAAASARGDFAGAVAAIPNAMVATFSTVGTPDEVREQVERLAAHADSVTLVPPGIGGTLPPDRIEAYREAIIGTFFPDGRPSG